MDRAHYRIPDSFDLVRMRRFDCPVMAPGGCGYVASYVAPAERFADYQSIFADSTGHRPLQKVTCAELKKRLRFDPTTKRGDNDWKFDCTNTIELLASAPYENIAVDYPTFTIARDSQVATIYFYLRAT